MLINVGPAIRIKKKRKKDVDFHEVMRVMLEDCWDYMSADGAGSGQVSLVMTEAEKQAKDKDKMATSKEGNLGKKKIKKDLWEN